MELTDLQKLESAPDLGLERMLVIQLFDPRPLFYLDHLRGHKVELQNHFDLSGFDFLIPADDEREHLTHSFDKDANVYLYHILNNTFGPPTIRERSLKSESYLLTSGTCLFEVNFSDGSFSHATISSVMAIGRNGSAEGNLKNFVHMLQSEINKLKRLNWLDAVAAESATYFENPFSFYFEEGRKQLDAINFYDDVLFEEAWEIQLEIEELDALGDFRDHEQSRIAQGIEFYEYYTEVFPAIEDATALRELEEKKKRLEYFEDLSRTAVFFLFVASLEGLLNLIYEIYLLKELREDERIKAFISRVQIDVKLRAMPVYCSCFKSRLIGSDETFKKIHSIFNLRNDLVHANMTSAMTAKRYEVHGKFFRSHEDKKNKYGLPQSARALTIENLQFVCETVEKMVEQIMASMKPRYRREFEQVLHRDSFYARLIDGEYVIDVDEK